MTNKEFESIVGSVFGDRFKDLMKRKSARRWGLHPEDATPWYVWTHLGSTGHEAFRRDWVKNAKGKAKHLRRVWLNRELMEWYEEAYEHVVEDTYDEPEFTEWPK